MQKFRTIALKMTELWPFELLILVHFLCMYVQRVFLESSNCHNSVIFKPMDLNFCMEVHLDNLELSDLDFDLPPLFNLDL